MNFFTRPTTASWTERADSLPGLPFISLPLSFFSGLCLCFWKCVLRAHCVVSLNVTHTGPGPLAWLPRDVRLIRSSIKMATADTPWCHIAQDHTTAFHYPFMETASWWRSCIAQDSCAPNALLCLPSNWISFCYFLPVFPTSLQSFLLCCTPCQFFLKKHFSILYFLKIH